MKSVFLFFLFLPLVSGASLDYPELPKVCKNLNSVESQNQIFRDLDKLKTFSACSRLPVLGSCEGLISPILAALPFAVASSYKASPVTVARYTKIAGAYADRSLLSQAFRQKSYKLAVDLFKGAFHHPSQDIAPISQRLPAKFQDLSEKAKSSFMDTSDALYRELEHAMAEGVKLVDINGKLTEAAKDLIEGAMKVYQGPAIQGMEKLFEVAVHETALESATIFTKILQSGMGLATKAGMAVAKPLAADLAAGAAVRSAAGVALRGGMVFAGWPAMAVVFWAEPDATSSCDEIYPPHINKDSDCHHLVYSNSPKTDAFLNLSRKQQIEELRKYPGECSYFEKFAKQVTEPKYTGLSCKKDGFAVTVNDHKYTAHYDENFFIDSIDDHTAKKKIKLSNKGALLDQDPEAIQVFQRADAFLTKAHLCCSNSGQNPESCINGSSPAPAVPKNSSGVL